MIIKFTKNIFLFSSLAIHLQILPTISFKNPDEMLAFVKPFLPESPVILEAGGHFGEDTNRMKSLWPNATMLVFEPLPSSFEIMVRETQHLPDVICYPYALTTFSGKTHFYIDIPNNAASSIGYPVEWNESEFDKTPIEVPCITLNDWAHENNISHIDFMWLDMEGHEYYALQNGLDILKTVKAIYTEISFVPVREGSTLYPDFKKFLESEGFCEVWKSCDVGRYGDALFIKKDILNQ